MSLLANANKPTRLKGKENKDGQEHIEENWEDYGQQCPKDKAKEGGKRHKKAIIRGRFNALADTPEWRLF